MLVGFIHGVMNTDNMTISGETIDYGPCAFMDAFDPATVFSSIDHGGRYAYGNQPRSRSGTWPGWPRPCCPCLHDDQEQAVALAVESLGAFRRQYRAAWSAGMRAKLGLPDGLDDAVTVPLVDELLTLLQDEPGRSHVVLPCASARPPAAPPGPHPACLSTAPLRRLGEALACPGPERRLDGPG